MVRMLIVVTLAGALGVACSSKDSKKRNKPANTIVKPDKLALSKNIQGEWYRCDEASNTMIVALPDADGYYHASEARERVQQ